MKSGQSFNYKIRNFVWKSSSTEATTTTTPDIPANNPDETQVTTEVVDDTGPVTLPVDLVGENKPDL